MREGGGPDFDLRPLYAPRSVAIVGASPRGDLATTIRDNITRLGGEARCYFVNPRYETIDGTPCAPDLAALPEVPDTVVLAVNPLRAAGFTRQAAEAGVPAVVIPGGGVVEGGEAAAAMQLEVADIARATGTTILGPNCMGLIDLTTGCATYIDEIHPWLRRGGVAGISQSGSVADAFLHSGTRIGWSRIVSSGSEVVIDLCDHLAHSLDDPETRAVVLFLEGIRRPERFLALADRALELGKPILAVKVGRSRQAQAAAIAHTGALTGEDRAAEAAFRAAGIVRCDDLDDLLEAAALVSGSQAMDRSVGRGRTAVVTVSTGEGSLVADLAARVGLDLPVVPEAARARIAADMPTLGYIGNPMDPWGATEASPAYRSCFTAFADSGVYDVLALVHDFPFRSTKGELDLALELAGELIAATAERPQVVPIFVSLTSGDPSPEIVEAADAAGGMPVLRGTVAAFASVARLAWWEARRERRLSDGPARPAWPSLATDLPRYGRDPDAAGTPPVDLQAEAFDRQPPLAAGAGVLPERESLEALRAAGIPVVTAVPASTSDEAVAAAARLGWPVVVKLDATGLAHKSDLGGVVVGLETEDGVRAAFDAVVAAGLESAGGISEGGRIAVRGVLVEPQVPAGVELIVGAQRDPHYGPLVLVGLGGILAEALDDVTVRPGAADAGRSAGHAGRPARRRRPAREPGPTGRRSRRGRRAHRRPRASHRGAPRLARRGPQSGHRRPRRCPRRRRPGRARERLIGAASPRSAAGLPAGRAAGRRATMSWSSPRQGASDERRPDRPAGHLEHPLLRPLVSTFAVLRPHPGGRLLGL